MKSTIIVQRSTRERLKQVGRKGESYDDLINALLDMKKESSFESGFETPSPKRESGT
jgi:predicted CopG family antitoxin